ncbi:transcriptional initiation protein Tat [Aliivibrio kagoshimensis]
MTDKKIDSERRSILKGIATVATATAISTAVTSTAKADDTIQPSSDENKKGYHETQHIRDYYNTL